MLPVLKPTMTFPFQPAAASVRTASWFKQPCNQRSIVVRVLLLNVLMSQSKQRDKER